MRHFPIKEGSRIVGIVTATDIVKSTTGFSFGRAISEGVTQSKYYYERRE
jgi:CBS domain-containing protein